MQFVLTSPVSRKELLTYHALKQFQAAISLPALFALVVGPGAFFDVYVRLCSGILAMGAFTLAVAGACKWLPSSVLDRLHKTVGAAFISILVAGVCGLILATFGHRRELVVAALNSPALHVALYPFYWGNALLFKPGFEATFVWAVTAGIFAFLCFSFALRHLDVQDERYDELREEIQQKTEKLKKQGFTLPRVRLFEVGVPNFPKMDGVGPILWRRCQEFSRHSPYLLVLLIAGAAYHGLFASLFLQNAAKTAKNTLSPADLNYLGQIIAIMIAFLVAAFDFNADTHRLEWLKALPLKSSRVVAGQLVLSSVYMACFISLLTLLNYGMLSYYLPQNHLSGSYFGYIALSLPLGVFYISAANALFLLVPTYGAERRSIAGFFQYICGVALLLIMMGVQFFVTNESVALAKHLGDSEVISMAIMILVFTAFAAGTFRIVIWAYDRFDISRVSR